MNMNAVVLNAKGIISNAWVAGNSLITECLGEKDKFKIVSRFPTGFRVWNIGRHNFPFSEYIPLAKIGEDGYSVDRSSLCAIRCKDEKTAIAILKQASKDVVGKKEFINAHL